MGLAVDKVDTELAIEVVIRDGIAGRVVMRHAVHGGYIAIITDGHQDRMALIQVLIADFLRSLYLVDLTHGRSIGSGQGLHVGMRAAAPALYAEGDARVHIGHNGRAALVEDALDTAGIPVNQLRHMQGDGGGGAIGGFTLFPGAKQRVLGQGGSDAVHNQVMIFLIAADGAGSVAVKYAVDLAVAHVAQLSQTNLYLAHRLTGGAQLQGGVAGFRLGVGIAALDILGFFRLGQDAHQVAADPAGHAADGYAIPGYAVHHVGSAADLAARTLGVDQTHLTRAGIALGADDHLFLGGDEGGAQLGQIGHSRGRSGGLGRGLVV